MTVYQQKSHIINKKEPISLIFKDIFCFQNSSIVFSPILQNTLIFLEACRYSMIFNN